MTQRTALIAAAALTAFVLVLVGGLAGRLRQAPPQAQAQEQAQPQSWKQTQVQGDAPSDQAAPSYGVSPGIAGTIALNVAPGATLARVPEAVSFQGTAAYEVQLDRGTVYVDANSGQVLYNGAAVSGHGMHEGEEGEEHESAEHDD